MNTKGEKEHNFILKKLIHAHKQYMKYSDITKNYLTYRPVLYLYDYSYQNTIHFKTRIYIMNSLGSNSLAEHTSLLPT
jgi:hypothetical protein